MQTLHIITSCGRAFMIPDIAKSIAAELRTHELSFLVRWHIAYQHPEQFDLCGARKMNEMIDLIPTEDWVWILDDDNTIHPDFFPTLNRAFQVWPKLKDAFVFSQNRTDALGPVLPAGPENMRVGRVDTAQVVFRKRLLGSERMLLDSKMPDGILYERIYKANDPKAFVFFPDAIVNFNGCPTPGTPAPAFKKFVY